MHCTDTENQQESRNVTEFICLTEKINELID